jgi:hypothetical protein
MSSELNDQRKAERHGANVPMFKKKTSFVWLVFVTDEIGPNSSKNRCGKRDSRDNGTHSADLNGIYTTELEAQRHADALGNNVDETYRRRRVQVVPVPVHHQFLDDNASKGAAWTFVATTDLESSKSEYSTTTTTRSSSRYYCI